MSAFSLSYKLVRIMADCSPETVLFETPSKYLAEKACAQIEKMTSINNVYHYEIREEMIINS